MGRARDVARPLRAKFLRVEHLGAICYCVKGSWTGAIAVMPWLAAVDATADAALLKNPLNQGTLVPSRTKVATRSRPAR